MVPDKMPADIGCGSTKETRERNAIMINLHASFNYVATTFL